MKQNFFPEFCEKEAKPSETVCISLSLALKRNFFRSEIGTPYKTLIKFLRRKTYIPIFIVKGKEEPVLKGRAGLSYRSVQYHSVNCCQVLKNYAK